MPMNEARAEIIADQYLQGKPYREIGQPLYPNASPQSQRQIIYNNLQSPLVQAKIAEKSAKIHSIDELKQIASKRIEQIDKTLSKGKLDKKIGLLSKEKDYLELQGKFQGAFIDKSMILTIDTTLDELDTRANQLLQGTAEQGRGEGKTD